ncbi:hypothetical protein C8R43DRAFT_1008722 [Mycena crocata]|nr:hypothetical protein C8R43DRAFT_1008722 [Mycena crocata]
MILLFLTTIIPAAVAALPGLSRQAPIVVDSDENCRFRLGERQYDLCPIFKGTAGQLPLRAKGNGAEYRFHLGSEESDVGNDCPPGTRICLVPEYESASHKATAWSDGSSIITVYSEESDEFISLHFSGNPATELQLVCDPQVDLGEPVLSRVKDALHSFTWRTKYGCESGSFAFDSILHTLDSESETLPPDDTGDPSQTNGESDESKQLLEDNRRRKTRRSTAIIFLVISIIVVSLSIISYKHPHRLNTLLTERIKPTFARLSLDNIHFPHISIPHSLKPAGEGRLVRWAHEDLELDEDFMVNGSDAYDELEDAGDENIPLRPSPRKGGRVVKNYGSGSATSPFW